MVPIYGRDVILENDATQTKSQLFWTDYYGLLFKESGNTSVPVPMPPLWQQNPFMPLGLTLLLTFLVILLVIFRQNPNVSLIALAACLVSLCVVLVMSDYSRLPVYS